MSFCSVLIREWSVDNSFRQSFNSIQIKRNLFGWDDVIQSETLFLVEELSERVVWIGVFEGGVEGWQVASVTTGPTIIAL